MKRRCLIAAVVAGFALLPLGAGAQSPDGKPTLFYIPHTHWEGAVFKTREEYLDMGLPNILKALALLESHPNFKFTLDQAAYVKPFLERYPEEVPAFKKYIAEGRLEMVGGMDVMPDDVKPGGELFVRQMQYGKRYFKERLGVDVTVAWMVDTFGHHPQMPQLLKQAGFTSFWFCRGVPNNKMPSEFLWQGIDGTKIPAFWLPGFYGLFYGPPDKPAEFANFFKSRYDYLNPFAAGKERVGLAGVDVSEPEPYVPPLVTSFNNKPDRPFTIRYSVPSEFADAVARRPNRPVIRGDFNPIFQGTYSSRIELKQATRQIEQRLVTAEKLSAIAAWLGSPADQTMLWRAWEPVLFNQTHDLASGVMTDHVYEDVRRGYDLANRLAGEMIDGRLLKLTARIDTRGAGIPVVVLNTLSWPRTDAVEVEVGFTDREVHAIEVLDAAGKPLAAQVVRADRYETGGIKRALIAFVAKNVPPLGYLTCRVIPLQSPSNREAVPAPGNVLENEFYRVTVDANTGAITSIFDKVQGWEALSGSANVVARQEDKGDLWELYHGLDGGSYIAMTSKEPVPTTITAKLSTEESGKAAVIMRGDACSEIEVTHPLAGGEFSTRIRLYPGVKRIDIETRLVNSQKYVRYQVLFPTSVQGGRNVQEIPFGAVERPVGIEFPAQQWVDYSGGGHGLALINAGMPGNLVNDGTLMLSLLRAHSIGGYGFGGGYEPGMTSDSGFEIGRPLVFHYSLVPHSGDWSASAVYRRGWEVNHPLVVRKAGIHAGTLPAAWSMASISAPNVVLTAFKPGPNGTTILRVFEASGKAVPNAEAKLGASVIQAWESDLLERHGKAISTGHNSIKFSLRPFEIKTIGMSLKPMGQP